MEAYLIENESVLALDKDTFSAVEVVEAELSLKDGRKTKDSDGRIDILATYSQEYIAIIELKLGQLEESHLLQMGDYLKQRDQIAKKYPGILSAEAAPTPKWIGVLVGTTIDSSLAAKLRNGHTIDGISIAALTVQRFRGSDGSILVTTDTYFSHQQGARDSTKYSFDGAILGKGRLVLAVVKRYVETHPNVTFSALEQAFPKDCQGSSGVLTTLDRANEIVARDRGRHFLNPEDLIQLADGTVVAVSNQWGVGNIERFIQHATRTLGYTIAEADG